MYELHWNAWYIIAFSAQCQETKPIYYIVYHTLSYVFSEPLTESLPGSIKESNKVLHNLKSTYIDSYVVQEEAHDASYMYFLVKHDHRYMYWSS